MQQICLGYIACSNAADAEFEEQLKQIDFKKLTHAAVAFSGIQLEDGKWIAVLSPAVEAGIQKIKAEITAQNANTKLLLSVGGAGCDGFCQAARTESGRRRFAESISALIDRFALAGADIDWEFPGESVLDICSCKHCKTDFILLLEALRMQLKQHILTIAVGSNRYFGIDVKRVGAIVDYVFVMTYDLGIMHSNAYLSKAFVTMWHLLGIPKDQLCIGVPLYGRNIKNLKLDMAFQRLSNGKIKRFLGQSFSRYENATWCFDTEEDVRKKARWAQKTGLGGIFCWEMKNDDRNRILNAMCAPRTEQKQSRL